MLSASAGQEGQGARRRRQAPRIVVVRFPDGDYLLDLVACRRAFLNGVVEGRYDDRGGLAEAVGVSRSTVSRFFSGRTTSVRVTRGILNALGLKFAEVARPYEDRGAEGSET